MMLESDTAQVLLVVVLMVALHLTINQPKLQNDYIFTCYQISPPEFWEVYCIHLQMKIMDPIKHLK